MSNTRQPETINMNFRLAFCQKTQALNEALSQICMNLYGAQSADKRHEVVNARMKSDLVFLRDRKIKIPANFQALLEVLEMIERRAEIKG